MTKSTTKKIGVCLGRHDIPGVTEYVFGTTVEFDVTEIDKTAAEYIEKLECDTLEIYVTGLTVATLAIVKAALARDKIHHVHCLHFDRDSSTYVPQIMK